MPRNSAIVLALKESLTLQMSDQTSWSAPCGKYAQAAHIEKWRKIRK
jgi:hypothetical protein